MDGVLPVADYFLSGCGKLAIDEKIETEAPNHYTNRRWARFIKTFPKQAHVPSARRSLVSRKAVWLRLGNSQAVARVVGTDDLFWRADWRGIIRSDASRPFCLLRRCVVRGLVRNLPLERRAATLALGRSQVKRIPHTFRRRRRAWSAKTPRQIPALR